MSHEEIIQNVEETHEMQLRSSVAKLQDYVTMNKEIAKENQEKDLLISKKEFELNEIIKTNAVILSQKQTHNTVMNDDIKFKYERLKDELESVDLRLKLLGDMENENMFFKESIVKLESELTLEMANKERMVKHLQVENKADVAVIAEAFVDELNKISFAAQKEAFAKTLTNAEREIVLMNSKLKDEVDFQLVGMVNLSDRLERQNIETNRLHMEIKTNQLKNIEPHAQLGSLRLKSRRYKDEIATKKIEMENLDKEKLELAVKIDQIIASFPVQGSESTMQDMAVLIKDLNEKILLENRLYDIWSRRQDRLSEMAASLTKYLKSEFPLLMGGGTGIYNGEVVKGNSPPSSASNKRSVKSPSSANSNNLDITEGGFTTYKIQNKDKLLEEIADDPDLLVLFKSIRGKENIIFTNTSSIEQRKLLQSSMSNNHLSGITSSKQDINVALWGINQIIQIWKVENQY